jgi:hypothetical protein
MLLALGEVQKLLTEFATRLVLRTGETKAIQSV